MSERVPEGWSKVKISSLISEITERTNTSNQHEVLSVTKDGIKSQREYFKKQIASEDNTGYKIVRKGNLVFGTMNLWMGSLDVLKKPAIGIVSPAYKTFKFNPEKCCVDFMSYFMRTPHMIHKYILHSQQGASIVRRNLDLDQLLVDEVQFPPLTEQKKIASILTSVDEVIENTQKQIDKLQDLKKATMNELLTKGIAHTEFKDSELGRIPKSWELVSLLSVSKKIKRGPSLSCNTDGKGIRYITSGNLVSDEVSLDGDYKFLDNFTDIEKCRLLKNDLVLNCVNSAAKIGDSAIFSLNIDAIVGFNNYAITFHTDVCNPNFIHYFTKTHFFRRQLKSVIKDAINQVSFSTKDLDLIQIALPPKSEQSEISQNINSIWENEKILTQKLSQTQSLKKSLMQDLLTGKKRVQI